MTYFQAFFLALIQGITEPFPVSSLGHAVLIPGILHWNLDEHSQIFLPFLTMLHFGTFIALSGVFWQEWRDIIIGLLGKNGLEARQNAFHLCLCLVIATLPAIFFGGLFEHLLRSLFANPLIVCFFLVCNGLLLLYVEKQRLKISQPALNCLKELSFKNALIIGFWQCLALFPGISRSGATINAGLLRGFSHWNATRFSLLMAQPVILAATTKEAWQLRHIILTQTLILQSLLGAIIAGVTALLCSIFLLNFFHKKDSHTLRPFGIYCLFAGLIAAILIII